MLERARHGELVRAPHRLVDLFAELLASPAEHLGLRVEANDVPAPELLLVQACCELLGLLRPARRARGRRVEHEAREPLRLGERVLEREHPAPRGAEEVDLAEAESLADRAQLVDERSDRPERRIVGPVRLAACGAEEVDLAEAESLADRAQLVDERSDRPERRIVGPVRLAARGAEEVDLAE